MADVTVFCLDVQAESEPAQIPGGTLMKSGLSVQKARTLSSYVGSWLRGLPLAAYRNWHPEAQAWIDRQVPAFDAVVFDTLVSAVYHRAGMPPAILIEMNAEHVLWCRAAATHARWILRPALLLESLRVRAFEARACRASKTVVTLTPEDAAHLAPLAPHTRFQVIPPCLLEEPRPLGGPPLPIPSGKQFLFVGTLSWEPNVDGLLWFVRTVWPKVRERHPDAVFNVIGKGLPEAAAGFLAASPGLRLLGFQEDLAPHYASARVVLAPLRFGSGIKLKVVEALSCGVPVLTTPVGAEGFATDEGLPFEVCGTNGEWLWEIDRLLLDDEAWSSQSQRQRRAYQTRYSTEARSQAFQRLLLERALPESER
jgi:glycosyltransferase involved in cell wall biosynthesis